MTTGFLSPLSASRYRLADATAPETLLVDGAPAGTMTDQDGLVAVDILVDDGKIAAITAPGATANPDIPTIPLDRGMVWPAFIELHTHLDKGHIWPRRRNPDGTFMGALENVGADRIANWTAEDVRRRMEFSLKSAYAHGTRTIRTHLDSLSPQHRISWPLFEAIRAEWADRIDLQAVALYGIDAAMDDHFFADIVATVQAAGGILGAVTYMVPDLAPALDRVFRAAIDNGLDVDFHVDETADPNARSLRFIAEAALRHGYQGQITVGHCCSLARQTPDEADRTLDLVAEAGIAVVSLPMCNMYLQDRTAGRTPRWRGITLLHEMKARGIAVSVSSDNTRDPFYAYGDLDGLEVFREAVRIAHLDHPFGDWPRIITATPADVMRLPDHGRLGIGLSADLVLFRARRYSELLSRPQSDRSVIRAGRLIDRQLPDYRDLDDILS